jgi:hypothetical protein
MQEVGMMAMVRQLRTGNKSVLHGISMITKVHFRKLSLWAMEYIRSIPSQVVMIHGNQKKLFGK